MAPSKKTTSIAKPTSTLPSALHPPYLQMISEAISSLKDRTGSSQPAIVKFIQDKYNKQLPSNFRKILSVQLKKFVKSEKLIKVKNSYKISVTATVKVKLDSDSTALTPKTKYAQNPKVVAKKAVEKGAKMKRLSQVKTPDVLKKSFGNSGKQGKKMSEKHGKMKQLDQVKTPQGLKKNAPNKSNN